MKDTFLNNIKVLKAAHIKDNIESNSLGQNPTKLTYIDGLNHAAKAYIDLLSLDFNFVKELNE